MADLHHVDDDHGLSAFTKEVVSRRGGTMSVEVATQLRQRRKHVNPWYAPPRARSCCRPLPIVSQSSRQDRPSLVLLHWRARPPHAEVSSWGPSTAADRMSLL